MPLQAYKNYLAQGLEDLPTPLLSIERDIRLYMFLRLMLLFSVLSTVIWQQASGSIDLAALNRSYILTGGTFALTSALILLYEKAIRFRYFLSSQIIYDVFFTTSLIFYTGTFESIYTIFYMFNVIFAAILFRSRGAIVTAIFCGILYLALNAVSLQSNNPERSYSVLTVLTALLAVSMLSGRLFDELKNSRQKIGRLEALNDEIIDSIDSGLVAIDRDGRIERINRTAADLFDIKNSEDVYGSDLATTMPQLAKVHLNAVSEFRLNDRSRRILVTRVDLPENHIMYLVRDLTDILDLEEKLRRQERLASVGRLAAGIAHEIRNPIASMSGAAQLLAAASTTNLSKEETDNLTKMILRESERVNRLISQLLKFSKPSDSPRELLSVDALIADACDSLRTRKELVGDAEIITSGDRGAAFLGHRDQWHEALTNLLINALQAGARKIEILVRKVKEVVEIEIKDDGSGISDSIKSRVFDPFFTTKPQGTGLGLAHVHRIVREHDGHIDVESQEGRGTQMKIKLPLAA